MFLPLQPNYVVCKYNPREDWISHNIAMSKSYEPKMSQRFLEMVKESGAEAENTGPGKKMVPRLRELFRQGQAEVVSNSKNKILATWELFFLPGPAQCLLIVV